MSHSSNIKVVNSRKAELKKLGFTSLENFLRADKNHMYVGRDMTHYVPGAVGSKWHNPFKSIHHNNDVELVLDKFKQYIRNGPLYNDLHELQGKTLACWCHPAPCHATALKELYEERYCNRIHETTEVPDAKFKITDFPPLKR